jgi:tetratricopeptide (TPR) repeat protein
MTTDSNANPEQLEPALTQLRAACVEFSAEHNVCIITDDVLKLFLKQTADIDFTWRSKLISFACNLQDDLVWDEVCKIYEYIIANETSDNHSGTYSVWIACGWILMTDDNKCNLQSRVHVAGDLAKIIERCGAGDVDSMAGLWGMFYYYHPLRNGQVEYFQQVVKWLEIAVEQKREDDELDSYTLCHLAHSYFQLGEAEKAVKYYEEINMNELEEEGEIGQQIVRARIAQCKQSLDC